jgi:hypothetical protein
MVRYHWIFSVTLLCMMGTLVAPVQAADEGQKKEEPSCGSCAQKKDGKPVKRDGCVCRLAKIADFGTTCMYWAMFCPPTGPYNWGSYTCLCGTAQYSGCTNATCPPTNCEPARKGQKGGKDYVVAPEVAEKGVEEGADDWEPTPDINHANYRVRRLGQPVFARVEFHDGQKLRVKLRRLEATPKKPLPTGEMPPKKEFGLGRQVGSGGHVGETIPKDKVDYSVAPEGIEKTRVVLVTDGQGKQYLVLLKDAVIIP